MGKTRLLVSHRDMLTAFAERAIECKDEQKARDKAYAKAEAAVRRCIEKQFPTADMVTLDRYAVSVRHKSVDGGGPNGQHVHFDFILPEGELPPPRPKRSYSSAESVQFDAAAVDAIGVLELADAALHKARSAKLSDYKALIRTAVTFEDILDVWPAATVLSDKIKKSQTALVILSADKIAAIRADNAGSKLPPEEIAAAS